MIGNVTPAPLYDKIADMERAFRFNGVTVTRQDYESMPCPMFATELSDEVMQKIAKDTYEYLLGNGWEDAQISKYLGDNIGKSQERFRAHAVLDQGYEKFMESLRDVPQPTPQERKELIEADALEADYWKFMEKAAIENGMRYYEDIGEK